MMDAAGGAQPAQRGGSQFQMLRDRGAQGGNKGVSSGESQRRGVGSGGGRYRGRPGSHGKDSDSVLDALQSRRRVRMVT